MSKEMLEAFCILEEEKHISKEDIIDAVKEFLKSAYKRRYGQFESCVIEFDDKKSDSKAYTVREAVEEVFDGRLEISLSGALKISSAYELGDKIRFEESVAEFGRIAAQSAKQTIIEKIRRQIREVTYNEYKQHEGEIMTGTVECFDQRFIYVNLGSFEAQLSHQDQIPGETFKSHDHVEVYVYKVENNPKGVSVFVSRSRPQFIKHIMEQEIPEAFDGAVEITSVSCEAGDRTKVVVHSRNPNVDVIGTIIGRGGSNIKKVTSKFHPKRCDAKAGAEVPVGENIDAIQWVEDPVGFIYNAIAPVEADMILFDEEDSKRAAVVVPDNRLSLAIGRRGQDIRLAARLTGYRVDIKSVSGCEVLEAERKANAAVVQGEVAPVEEAAESVETEVVANDAE